LNPNPNHRKPAQIPYTYKGSRTHKKHQHWTGVFHCFNPLVLSGCLGQSYGSSLAITNLFISHEKPEAVARSDIHQVDKALYNQSSTLSGLLIMDFLHHHAEYLCHSTTGSGGCEQRFQVSL
jgi:hypothetical protein